MDKKYYTTHQMDKSRAGKPNTDERRNELTEADTVWRFENVEILQDIRNGHQTQGSGEPQSYITISSDKHIHDAYYYIKAR